MVKVIDGKLIVEISGACPADDLVNKQKAIIRIIQCTGDQLPISTDDLYFAMDLLSDLMLDADQVEKALK